jgi:hypothetical protein
MSDNKLAPIQPAPLAVVAAREVNGLEMGVLEDGTGYLTARSLATLCGVAPSTILQQGQNWKSGKRDGRLARFILTAQPMREHLYIETKVNGTTVHAYTDDVCMLILEYYAFEAEQTTGNFTALTNYRLLARSALRLFIYQATGYDPSRRIPEAWRQFHDRLVLNVVPRGYFSVFREMSDIVLAAIQGGLTVDAGTVPDISVGRFWSAHWTENGLEAQFGERTKYAHNYPSYFPQAASNPQVPWAYPVAALGEFRRWMFDTYIREKFPNYLNGKVKNGDLPPSTAELILAAVDTPDGRLPPAPTPSPPVAAFAPTSSPPGIKKK